MPRNLLGLPTTGRKDWKLHPLTLAFRGEIQKYEKDFLNDYFNRSLQPFRFSIVLAIFFYGIFAFLDALMFPELKEIFWFIHHLSQRKCDAMDLLIQPIPDNGLHRIGIT